MCVCYNFRVMTQKLHCPSAKLLATQQIFIKRLIIDLTVLAVDAVKARPTLADITDERVTPVGLADFTRASIVAGVRVAGS